MALVRFRSLSRPIAPRLAKAPWLGWALALLAVCSFSIAPTISRAAILNGMDPTALVMARMTGTALLLGITIAVTMPHRLKMSRRYLLITLATGMINGFGFLTFFWALGRLEASIASMLFSLSPLVILGLLALRGEKLTRRHALRLALGLAGVYLLIGPGGQVDLTGVFLVLAAILSYSVHLVFVQWFLQDQDAWAVTFYAIVGITVVVVSGWLIEGHGWHDPGRQGWLSIVALVVISTYLARLALFGGVRHLGSGQVALLSPFETLLTIIWSLLFLQESLTAWQWLGGLAIFISMLLANRRLRLVRGRSRPRTWSKP